MQKNRHSLIAPLGLLSLTVLSGAFLMSSFVSADDSQVDNVSVTVPVSCSLEGTGMTSHNASIVNGTYQADIGTTTLKAFCNDTNGFAIYAIGYTDNEYGKTVLTNTTLGSTYDIATGTATSGNTSNWAMKLATSSGATYPLTLDNSFGSYHAVPAEYTKVAHRDNATDIGTGATGSTLTTTYAAFMSQTQPAGTYTGQVKYTLVHPSNEEPAQPRTAASGCINYFANTSTAIGEMGCQTISTSATAATLWASNFKRDGYGFAGWNDKYDYSGNFYGPNQTITFTAGQYTGDNNGLALYAVWVKSAGTIQNWNGCSSLTQAPADGTAALSSVTALTDTRDNDTYAVARLADGNCWTIENLRLADKDSSNNDINLSSTNTHNPSLPLTNTWWYSFANDSDAKSTSNHLSATTDPTQTAWCNVSSSNCFDQSMLATNNITFFTNNTSLSYSASSNVYSYGNYYNWYSATAGHGKYGNDYGSSYTAPGDICPVGWHLPTGKDASGEFGSLDIAIGGTGAEQSTEEASNRWRTYPNNFIHSGCVDNSSIINRNSGGDYWSTSGDYSHLTYIMHLSRTYIAPGTDISGKGVGQMVRCVADV